MVEAFIWILITEKWKYISLFGQPAMVVYILMMVFTPLKIGNPVFLVGATVYLNGFVLEISALHYFRKTPVGQPVVNGSYRASRNPQWLGLFLVLSGSAIAIGIWLTIGMVVLVGIIYHQQILNEEKACIEKYGERLSGVYGANTKLLSFSIKQARKSTDCLSKRV
jgi:hypothetical protein